MTNAYKDHDLTTIVERVAKARYERDRNAVMDRTAGAMQPPAWGDLDALQRHEILSLVTPIVVDVIDAITEEPA
jgi:hypothetical protein